MKRGIFFRETAKISRKIPLPASNNLQQFFRVDQFVRVFAVCFEEEDVSEGLELFFQTVQCCNCMYSSCLLWPGTCSNKRLKTEFWKHLFQLMFFRLVDKWNNNIFNNKQIKYFFSTLSSWQPHSCQADEKQNIQTKISVFISASV